MDKPAREKLDRALSRIMAVFVALLLGSLVWKGCLWAWDWYGTLESGGDAWASVWEVLKQNLSVVVLVYGMMCLQASGVAELKFNRSFLKAFALALILTPPVMMGVYGHKKDQPVD